MEQESRKPSTRVRVVSEIDDPRLHEQHPDNIYYRILDQNGKFVGRIGLKKHLTEQDREKHFERVWIAYFMHFNKFISFAEEGKNETYIATSVKIDNGAKTGNNVGPGDMAGKGEEP